MTTVLIIVLVALMVMVVVSLIRGVVAFMKSTKIDLETGRGETATEMQLMQNRMMMNRIRYQALAILVVAALLVMAR